MNREYNLILIENNEVIGSLYTWHIPQIGSEFKMTSDCTKCANESYKVIGATYMCTDLSYKDTFSFDDIGIILEKVNR